MNVTLALPSGHEVHHAQHNPPLIRLQVWCYTELGRNSRVNLALATFLSKAQVEDWTITPASSSCSAESSRDKYAPIEVELKHTPPTDCDYPSSPEESLRELFRLTLPPLIEKFSIEKDLTPQHVAMFPVGDELPRDVVQKYSHVQVMHPLAMDHTRVAHVGALERNGVEEITQVRSLAIMAPDVIVAGHDISINMREMIQKSIRGAPITEDWLRVKAMVSKKKLPDDVLEQTGKYESGVDLCATPEMKDSWNKVLASSACFRILASDMKECASRISQGSDVGNEDLYGIVTGMTVAMASLSWHREEVKTLNDLICKRYGEQEKALKGRAFITSVIFVASVLVATAMAPFVGTAAVVVGGALVATPSAVFTGKDVREMCNSRNKRAEAGALEELHLRLESTLGGAQIAVSAMFCEQVLKMPLDLMSRSGRKEVLQGLGVDVDQLQDKDYQEGLVLNRIKQFCGVLEELDMKRQEVGKEFGLVDVKQATFSNGHGQANE